MSRQPPADEAPSDDARSPLAAAATVGAAATVVLVALSVGSDQPVGEGIAAALSNGLVLFFLVAGMGYVKTADRSIASVAIAAAIGTLATVLTVRLVAVVSGASGPFGSVVDTVLDVAARAIVVLIFVAATGHWSERSGSDNG